MEHFTLSTVLVVALLLSTGLVRSLPVDTGDDLGTIIFSSVLFRHGDRAPTGAYPNDIYNEEAKYWPRGYGQLSEIGEEQHFKQGSFFRKRYNHILPETYNVNDLYIGEEQHFKQGSFFRKRYNHILPEIYNVNDTYVRSSNIDRTLASARAHLAGLYPPTEQNLAQPNINFQVIPIHTTDMANDKLIWPTINCDKYSTLSTYLEESDEYQCVMNTTATVQSEVAELAGYSTFASIVYDILFIEELYNLSIPEWTTSYYPQPLRNLFLLESFIAAAGTEELQRLSTEESDEYQCVMNTTSTVQNEVTELAGYSTFSSGIYDILFIEQLYNLSIPKWTSSYYPQPLRNLYLLETFISAAGTEELQRLSTGPLLKEIIANTQAKVNGTLSPLLKEIISNSQAKVNGTLSPDRGLYIYSAHDGNVVDLLQGLDVFNGLLVPYASAVMIELRNKSDEYFITVSYKNSTETDPYLLQLPGCDALCPLDSFVELTKPIIPDDLTTECAEEVVAGQEYHFEIPAAGNIAPIML
ncbi:unnamed protein product [Timema podura]|uniref:acid phosphatase n=1 Tax=Timema podura TaxID=61482 RepID=A0ABN7NFH2_TIMPD|nr:unnamed protein product [Timema podura]